MYWRLSETDKDFVEKALETGTSLFRVPTGELGRGLI
jgi:hypothetical protein